MAGAEPIGFVDVPGHQRFIRNMLAGAGAIDFALLVVAANDGVMPVIGRIERDALCLGLRCLDDEQTFAAQLPAILLQWSRGERDAKT